MGSHGERRKKEIERFLSPLNIFLWAESHFWESFFLRFWYWVRPLWRTWPHGRNMVQVSVLNAQNVDFRATWETCVIGRSGARETEDEAYFKLCSLFTYLIFTLSFLALYWKRCAWNYHISSFSYTTFLLSYTIRLVSLFLFKLLPALVRIGCLIFFCEMRWGINK